jgi:hypothetical protein
MIRDRALPVGDMAGRGEASDASTRFVRGWSGVEGTVSILATSTTVASFAMVI